MENNQQNQEKINYQEKEQVLKETIKSLRNDFNNLNKEIDILKENKQKESALLKELNELKKDIDKLRKSNNSFKKSIELLDESIHCLIDEDDLQSNPWLINEIVNC